MHTRTNSILGFAVIGLASVLSGCGEPDDRPSAVHTLRVLAVRAETPLSTPGSAVELSALVHDGSARAKRADGSQRTTSMLWIGGCSNPPGDSYLGCMPYLHEVTARLGNENLANRTLPADAPAGIAGWGERFSTQMPADVISSRQMAAGVVYPYGVEFVFVAYCGGVLRLIDADRKNFPLGCFDPDSGDELGRDDFEFGFYPVYAYETLENENPILSSMAFEDEPLGASCSESEPCNEGYHCGTSGLCIPVVARCTQADADDCESHVLSVTVPRSSVERAASARVTVEDAFDENIWISYFANAGSFEEDSRIINDAHSGWSDDVAGKWRARTDRSQEVRLWAVVRDNRNGVAWDWRDVWVE